MTTAGKGKVDSAHRVSYRLFNGEIPDGMFVCHRCDTPSCVNPSHLFLGMPSDNSKDMVTKGRQARGSRQGNAKLSESDVGLIRRMIASGDSDSHIASHFNVVDGAISHIRHGRAWRHAA